MNATIRDVESRVDTLMASVQAEDSARNALVAYIDGLQNELAGAKASLASALSNNTDPDVQAASDKLDTLIAKIDSQTVADAVFTNTPSAADNGAPDTTAPAQTSDSAAASTSSGQDLANKAAPADASNASNAGGTTS